MPDRNLSVLKSKDLKDIRTLKKQNRTYLTEKKTEIISWFNRHAPQLGELYEGALIIISQENFPGYAVFVSHTVREIRNRLPDIILGKEHINFKWKEELSELMIVWKSAGLLISQITEKKDLSKYPEFENTISINLEIYNKINQILNEYEENNEIYRARVIRLFNSVSDGKNSEQVLRPIVSHWLEITDWFYKIVHPGTKYKQIDKKELLKKFEYFENILSILQGYIFRATKELDEILDEANS